MTVLNPAQQSVLEMLRGEPDDRPTFDPEFRNHLQTTIDEALSGIDQSLRVDKHSLKIVHQCEGKYAAPDDPFHWNVRNARGTIAHVAFELAAGGKKRVTPAALTDMALESVCSRPATQSLADYVRELDDIERAELRVAVVDLVVKYTEMFPAIPDGWIPNAEATTAASFNRKVVLYGKIDLKLGSPQGNKAASMIIDFKTGAPALSDMDDLRLYALVETLRTGTPPFKWASVYLDAGRFDAETVTDTVLLSAARRVIDGAKKMHELNLGRAAKLSPGHGCRFCPANEICEAAVVDFDQSIHVLT